MLEPTSLTRHAVCVGMTGSGKTGLCLSILEDLAGAGVPIVALDPKGDLTNLALVFPDLNAASFRPWIDPAEAARAGVTPDVYAEQTAARWREGLAAAGRTPADVAAWKARVEVIVMTPGSESGRPIDVLSALTRAPAGLDPEGLRAYVTGAVGALLGLVGEPSNPLTDPGAILLARLLGDAFEAGKELPLGALLPQIIDPPFDRLGYFPMDDVMPPKARTALALKLNNVVASPAFASWRTGEPLDLAAWTAPVDGRTPVRVLVLSHLSDAERMFFVSMMLHAVVAWTRRLRGTSELRALVYFDEVFGFLPPHPKEPPSKGPILTLMKQARAVGVGVMLATQNPVDVDYKALSNAGTWLVGRLQTENDRDRVLEGLMTHGADLDRKALDAALGSLPPRTFVVRDAFGRVGQLRSRQTMAYLRGPLTRVEVASLEPREPVPLTVAAAPTRTIGPPPTPAGVEVRWLDEAALPDAARSALPGGDADGPAWRPMLYLRVDVRFREKGWEDERVVHRLWTTMSLADPPVALGLPDAALRTAAPDDGEHALLPTWIDQATEVTELKAAVVDQLARSQRGRMWRRPGTDDVSLPGESAESFAARVGEAVDKVTGVDVAPARGGVKVGWTAVVWVRAAGAAPSA